MAGAPAFRCTQRCTQPPAPFVPRPSQPRVPLPSISQPVGHFQPGLAPLGSEKAVSAVSGAPGLNFLPTHSSTKPLSPAAETRFGEGAEVKAVQTAVVAAQKPSFVCAYQSPA